jgi:hypothetical protein
VKIITVITVVKFLNLLYDGRVSKGTRVTKNASISDVAQSCRRMILPERVFDNCIVNRAPEDLANPPFAKRDSLSIRVQARGLAVYQCEARRTRWAPASDGNATANDGNFCNLWVLGKHTIELHRNDTMPSNIEHIINSTN